MKARCYYKKDSRYMDYGGRGITVCKEWLDSFQAFYDWAMANGYADDLTIDRIDVDGNYEPSNCRWATRKQQGNNKRSNVLITYGEETHTLAEWAEKVGIKRTTLVSRLFVNHWDIEKALFQPVRGKKPQSASK